MDAILRKRLMPILLAVACLLAPLTALADNTLDLTRETFDTLSALEDRIREAPDMSYINLRGVKLSIADRLRLMEAFPDKLFLWEIDVCGRKCDSAQTELDMHYSKPEDYDEFIDMLRCLPRLKRVRMLNLYVSRSNMALLTNSLPDIRFDFTFRLSNYTIRTTSTAFSTLKDGSPPYLTSEAVGVFKYCKDMLALDLGHNAIDDLSFLRDMPQLKILILACNRITDMSDIAYLKDLEYLEIFKNPITDISALSGLTKLIDLNLSNLEITDVSPLFELKQLERLWLSLNPKVPKEQFEALRQALPNTLIVTDGSGSTSDGWRNHYHYKIIYRTFNYGSYLPWDAPPFGS